MTRAGGDRHGSAVVEGFVERGWDFFTGVPCSLLAGVFSTIEQFPARGKGAVYVPAAREDAAAAVTAGAFLSGRRPVLCMQNSGLGYCLNTLTSLHLIYRIPVVLVISWRGYSTDAVEHLVMGRVLPDLLDSTGIPHRVLDEADKDVQWGVETASEGRGPAALLVTEKL